MKKDKKGFTLVELVIVIAVIAILASVLIPTFAGILERARESARVQRATSIRDEFISSSDKYYSVEQIKDYVIKVDDSFYKISDNGGLTNITEQEFSDNYSLTTSIESQGIVLYTPVSNTENTENDDEINYADWKAQLNLTSHTATFISYSGNLEEVTIPSHVSAGQLHQEYSPVMYWDLFDDVYFGAVDLPTLVAVEENGEPIIVNDRDDVDALQWTYGIDYGDTVYYVVTYNEVVEGNDYEVTGLSGTFKNNSTITQINFPNTIISIGGNTFNGCSSIEEITLPESLTDLASFALSGMTGITSITVPAGVTELNSLMFAGSTSLETITLEGVEVIWDQALSNATATTINLPTTLRSIDGYGFSYCPNLETLVIPEGVEYIGAFAFSSCSKLVNVTLPATIKFITSITFGNCPYITNNTQSDGSIIVPTTDENKYICLKGTGNISPQNTLWSKVYIIANEAFLECNVTSLTFTSNLRYLCDYCLFELTSLQEIIFEHGADDRIEVTGNVLYEEGHADFICFNSNHHITISVKYYGNADVLDIYNSTHWTTNGNSAQLILLTD